MLVPPKPMKAPSKRTPADYCCFNGIYNRNYHAFEANNVQEDTDYPAHDRFIIHLSRQPGVKTNAWKHAHKPYTVKRDLEPIESQVGYTNKLFNTMADFVDSALSARWEQSECRFKRSIWMAPLALLLMLLFWCVDVFIYALLLVLSQGKAGAVFFVFCTSILIGCFFYPIIYLRGGIVSSAAIRLAFEDVEPYMTDLLHRFVHPGAAIRYYEAPCSRDFPINCGLLQDFCYVIWVPYVVGEPQVSVITAEQPDMVDNSILLPPPVYDDKDAEYL